MSADLAPDATRDFRDLGALDFDGVEILDMRRMKVKNTQKLSELPVRCAWAGGVGFLDMRA